MTALDSVQNPDVTSIYFDGLSKTRSKQETIVLEGLALLVRTVNEGTPILQQRARTDLERFGVTIGEPVILGSPAFDALVTQWSQDDDSDVALAAE